MPRLRQREAILHKLEARATVWMISASGKPAEDTTWPRWADAAVVTGDEYQFGAAANDADLEGDNGAAVEETAGAPGDSPAAPDRAREFPADGPGEGGRTQPPARGLGELLLVGIAQPKGAAMPDLPHRARPRLYHRCLPSIQ